MTTVPTPIPNVLAYAPPQQISTIGAGAKQAQTAPAGAAVNAYIDCNAGSLHQLELVGAASTTTVEFINPQPGQVINLYVKQSASGSDLITWINCLWASATPPTLTTTASHLDWLRFVYDDVTARWSGFVVAADFS